MGQPINAVLEFSIRGTINGQNVISVLHYRVSAVSGAATAAIEQDEFLVAAGPAGIDDVVTPYLSCCPSNYTATELRAQFVAPTRFRFSTVSILAPGTRPAASNFQNSSAVMTKRTALSGRRQIGSLHFPGVADTDAVGGLLSAGLTSAMNTAALVLQSNLNALPGTGIYVPVLWHRTLPSQPQSDPVIQFATQTTLRIMRRRTVGVGI